MENNKKFLQKEENKVSIESDELHGDDNSDSIKYTEQEPKERSKLPWLKDPNLKMGLWSIIKDNIGKDFSKIAVPVFFNDPMNMLQKCANSLEYASIIEAACHQ